MIAPKNVYSWANDKQIMPGGSYGEWLPQYNIDPIRYKPGAKVMLGKTHLATYETFKDFPVDKNTIVIADEAHGLKNIDSAKATAGIGMIKKAGGVYYMTATPADKPYHIQYLEGMGVLEGKSPKQAIADLGMELVEHTNPKTKKSYEAWEIKKGFTPQMIRQRFASLFDRMIKDGRMRKDEIAWDNLDFSVQDIKIPKEAIDVMEKINTAFDPYGDAKGLKRAVNLMHQRRAQEPYKIDQTVSMVQKDIAAGRKAVVFLSRVNRSDVIKREKMWMGGELVTIENLIHTSEGTAKTMKQKFADLGMRVVEIHGESEVGNSEAMRQFQSGEADVVIATAPSGGVGINLDDTVGNAPRTIYVMTPEFDAMNNVQLVGRGYRASTKSRAKVVYLFGNTPIDQWNASILSDKIKTLSSIVKGESENLDIAEFMGGEEQEPPER